MSPGPRVIPADLRTGSEEQAAVRDLYERVGCRVFATSERRKVDADPGIADLIVLCPRRRSMWFHESKAGTGRQSDAQRKFQLAVEKCAIAYVLGGETAARAYLQAIGLLLG